MAPAFYLQDLVAIVLVIINFEILKKEILKNKKKIGLVLGLTGINVLIAIRPEVAFFRWLTLFKLIFIGWLVWHNKSLVKKMLAIAIPCWFGYLAFLDLAQVAVGSSLQGIFYWLGERKFSYMTSGVALMSLADDTFVRAYGTFSHPNVQAGFVGACMLLWQEVKVEKLRPGLKKVLYYMIWWLGLGILFLTGSRVVIVTVLGVLAMYMRISVYKKLVLGVGLLGLAYLVWNWGGRDGLGWDKRIWLVEQTMTQIKQLPVFGVGLGNNILSLDASKTFFGTRWIQPVHNLFLLLVSEVGIVGTVIIIYLGKNIKLSRILLFVLITGLVDHYWITGVQTASLGAVILGLVYDKKNAA